MATANTKRNADAQADDLYETPAYATTAILRHVGFEGVVTDAGCGLGAISKVLEASGYDVDPIDLNHWGYGRQGVDFLTLESADNIISNPPFKLLNQWLAHALAITKKKVVIFARVTAMETQARGDIFDKKPPQFVYTFNNRVDCPKAGHAEGSSAVFYCWLVWDLENPSTDTIWRRLSDKSPTKSSIIPTVQRKEFSRIRQLILEAETAYRSMFNVSEVMNEVSVSGGKDSAVVYSLVNELTEGRFNATHCDTGNEHPLTTKYVKNLHENVGKNAPPVNILQPNFTEEMFVHRRALIRKNWVKPHVIKQGVFAGRTIPPATDAQIQAALDETYMRDNSMLNVIILHGSMPTRLARFCTQDLKIDVMFNQVLLPALAEFDGEIVNFSGVRGDESERRSHYKWCSEDPRGEGGFLYTFLPIHKWNVNDVWAYHKYKGIAPNPLYHLGSSRVGCWPCVMSNKAEIANVAKLTPEKIEEVRKWEVIAEKINRYTAWRRKFEDGKFDMSFLLPRKSVGAGANVNDIVRWSLSAAQDELTEPSSDDMNCKLGNHNFCE